MTKDRRAGAFPLAPSQKILPPFIGPKLKIWRGLKHLDELKSVVSDFAKNAEIKWMPHDDPLYEDKRRWMLSISTSMPAAPSVILGDAAHNFRSALDILMCDIARLRGKSTDGIKFLFATDAVEWNIRLKKSAIRRLGKDVVDAVRDLEPYRAINSGIRALHDLDILDKHEVVVLPFTACWAKATIPDELRSVYSPNVIKGDKVRFSEEDVVYIRKGMEETHLPKLDSEPILIFGGGLPQGSPFAGEPVIETLERAAETVSKIVDSFEVQFGRRDGVASGAPSVDDGSV